MCTGGSANNFKNVKLAAVCLWEAEMASRSIYCLYVLFLKVECINEDTKMYCSKSLQNYILLTIDQWILCSVLLSETDIT